MAYRMQTSVPEAWRLAMSRPRRVELYGEEARQAGTFAANCLLARRLAERDVRFIQLIIQAGIRHGNLPAAIRRQCADGDRASYHDHRLKQRGCSTTRSSLGGEFAAPAIPKGIDGERLRARPSSTLFHHLVARGHRPGMTFGATDDFGTTSPRIGACARSQATLMQQLGIDHEKLTYKIKAVISADRVTAKSCRHLQT